jgi:hypothetical protein
MKNTLLISIILLGVALHGCSTGSITTYINVNPALKAAFNYKVGSYWIYQDSLSGETDSFFVQSNSDTYSPYYTPPTSNPQKETEEILITVLENNTNLISPGTTANWNFGYFENEIDLTYGNGNGYNNFIYYWPFINYPNDSTLTSYGYGAYGHITDTGKIISTFSQLIVDGRSYQNVIEVNHYANMTIDSIDYVYNDTFFVTPGAGMLKMILHHHPFDSLNSYRVWELQRYKIVK